MASTTSARQPAFRRADWFVAAMVVVVCLGLHYFTSIIRNLEYGFYDAATTATRRAPAPDIVLIAIDAPSLERVGPWPWPRDVHARLIDLLAAADAKTIVYAVPFYEPQTDRGLAYLRQIRSALDASPSQAAALPAQISRTVTEAEAVLDTDARLVASIARAGNVLLASSYLLGTEPGREEAPLALSTRQSMLTDPGPYAMAAVSGQRPLAALGQAAAGVGHLNVLTDVDGVTRQVPLLLRHGNAGVPSLALLAAAHSLRLGPADLRPGAGNVLRMGALTIPTNAAAVARPQVYAAQGSRPVFAMDSLHDVLTGKLAATRYQGKVVLIGATAPGVEAMLAVPGGQFVAPVQVLAHTLSSIRQGRVYTEPASGESIKWIALLLVALYLALVLPRLPRVAGAVTFLALLCALLVTQWVLLQQANLWLHLILPALVLLAGQLAHGARGLRLAPVAALRDDGGASQADRLMGLALQGQGQLDMAFERLRRVPPHEEVLGNLYHLAQDFEGRHQFDKAQAVYEHILHHSPGYGDASARCKRAIHFSAVVASAGGPVDADSFASTGVTALPQLLGRYQIEKELGRGAMGVVYQGRDPKIGRVVAIKALALGDEFEGNALVDARERFFREAESAGRLQHQNIVTIYDAGEDHGLAWIAMEFLKGQDLSAACRSGHLLAVPQVLSIAARVADALDYAHLQNIVHRDIKPANIMFDAATDTVKVSDFGIARITDSSKTRAGLVLGTPSFMAPEQLAGQKVDGRSDLYALGVTLFQLLTGVLPLRGSSMGELMRNIAHVPAPDVRELRPDIAPEIARIVAQMLQKNPQERYQTGRQLADDLRKVLGVSMVSGTGSEAQVRGYDQPSDLQEHKMVDFQETVMDSFAPQGIATTQQPGAR